MRASGLWTVKVIRPARKPQAQVGFGEKFGDLMDGVVERRIVIGHEGLLGETTHNDLRFAVETLSGGLVTRLRFRVR